MILLPPRSPLFPYTTLFRSTLIHDLRDHDRHDVAGAGLQPSHVGTDRRGEVAGTERLELGGSRLAERSPSRSEEHTSELQSLRHLVCRLLLEKKKMHLNSRL